MRHNQFVVGRRQFAAFMLAAFALTACGRPSAVEPRVVATESAAVGAHFGDGVCSAGFAAYGGVMHAADPSLIPVHAKADAISLARAAVDNVPVSAIWGAYFAIVDQPAGYTQQQQIGYTPRPMWIVEIGNFTATGPGAKAATAANPSPAAGALLHHTLIGVDDQTGQIVWLQSCP